MITKQLIKLSKQLLLDLASLKNTVDDSVNFEPEYKDYSKCSCNCPFYKNRETSDFCKNQCVFVLSTSSIVKERTTLTHTQINQLLFYHSVVFEKNGLTIELSHKNVAKAINCSVRTAKDNITDLVNAGYIILTSIDKDKYKVFIKDYYKYHTAERGHLYLTKECFSSLIKIDNINSLRVALNSLVKLDDMKVSKAKEITKTISFKAIINMLPSNITCIKQVKKILSKIKALFKMNFISDSVTLSFNTDIESTEYNKKLQSKNKKALAKLIKRMGININNKDKEDIVQMSVQYNIHVVANAIKLLSDKEVENFGAYLRTVIRKNFPILMSQTLISK